MKETLLVVESPSKAITLKGYLGEDFLVDACKGHVKDLPKNTMGVSLHTPYTIELDYLPGKFAILQKLKKLAKSVDRVLLATDPDREGEAIASHLFEELKSSCKNIQRIRFSEIQKSAILEAISHPTDIDQDLVESQTTRRIVDRLFGYQVSPYLWKRMNLTGLSAGRVQSVVLRWICEREEEILHFVPEAYLFPKLYTNTISSLEWNWDIPKDSSLKKQVPELWAKRFQPIEGIHKVSSESLTITETQAKNKENLPPPPFQTASLQEASARVLGFSSSKTMKLAQGLYEGVNLGKKGRQGLITYMRTDSTHISEPARKMGEAYILSRFGKEYLGTPKKRRALKNSQNAHEAIRPTSMDWDDSILRSALSSEEYKLYQLIQGRFLASLMAQEQGIEYTLQGKALGEPWIHKSFESQFLGWKVLSSKDKKSGSVPWKKVLALKDHTVERLEIEWKQTEPPSRFTEGTLVQKMEKTGVGRPSTYASTLEILKKRKYVELDKKFIFPLPLGKKVIELLKVNLSEIIANEFTSDLEIKLDSIAQGEGSKISVVKEFLETLHGHLQKPTRWETQTTKSTSTQFHPTSSGIVENSKADSLQETNAQPICPSCQKGIIQKKTGKKGKILYQCSRFPYCDYVGYAP